MNVLGREPDERFLVLLPLVLVRSAQIGLPDGGFMMAHRIMRYSDARKRGQRSVHVSTALMITLSFVCGVMATAHTRLVPPSAQQRADVNSAAQSDKDVRLLEQGKPIERELKGGEAHAYQVALTAGQYLRAVVEQRGIDVVVTLFGPDGKKLLEVDSPNGTQGPETVVLVAEAPGVYRMEVRSPGKDAPGGRYEVKLEELRAATEQDRSRIAAKRALMEGSQLREQATAESLRKAIKKYEEAVLLWRGVGDLSKEAFTLHSIGAVYSELGEMQNAMAYYHKALPLRRAVGDRGGESVTLIDIGGIYASSGEMLKALDFFNQALTLARAIGDREGEATALHNIGFVYRNTGELQKALDSYHQVLPLERAMGDRRGEASTLNGIGAVYASLGELQKALDYYNQVLPLRRAASDRSGEANTLSNIGYVYNNMGDIQKALDYYSQALPLRRLVGDRRGEANTLNNIGTAYRDLNEPQKALGYYNQALPLRRDVGDRSGEANTLHNIGAAHSELGEKLKAFDFFNQALTLRRAVGDRSGEAATLASIARLERDGGDLSEARSRIEAALNIIESIRTKIVSQELRTSYFASVQSYYEFYIDLLMRLHKRRPSEGFDAAGLLASERARARSLLELLAEARADIRQGIDPQLLERERTLQRQLNATAERQTRLLSGKHTKEQAAAIAEEVEGLTTELQQVAAQIRQRSPRYAALTQPAPLSLEEIQTEVLDPETLLLEYALGDERSYLWAVTPTSISSHELPKRSEIDAAARRVYELMTARNELSSLAIGDTEAQKIARFTKDRARIAQADAQLPEAASRLSQMLMSPVASQLGTKRLLIVSDGALRYIPFAVLPDPATADRGEDGRQPLVVAHEIVSLPSASTLAVLRRELRGRTPAARSVAVLADPVFGKEDVRVDEALSRQRQKSPGTRKDGNQLASANTSTSTAPTNIIRALRDVGMVRDGAGIPRLLFSGREANSILALAPPGEGMKRLGFEANRAVAISPELARYRMVHFATHGLLNSEHPELSGIVLSLVDGQGQPVDGFLRLHDIYNLRLSADMVVLSACQTALGKEIKGEGLVGLTRGFMYAGVPRVVASLWKVDDVATAELMKRFYRGILGDRLRPAAALRAAQVEMSGSRRWQSPYYWAAFELQGEWK